jgi:hypothetical protein
MSTTPCMYTVIVAGYSRKAAARVHHRSEIPVLVVEINHSVFGGLASHGFYGIWGDITGEEFLTPHRSRNARC